MSVRQSLLAILDQGPCYGYQLRTEFDRRTGSTWPLNVGQIYNTLDRLERDGLAAKGDVDEQGHVYWQITDAGRAAVRDWLDSPVERGQGTRDELAIKLAVASTLPGVDVAPVIQAQRIASLRQLQELTRAKYAGASADGPEELAWSLVVDSMIFAAEAEVRWLDHTEQRLALQPQHTLALELSTEKPRRGRPARAEASAEGTRGVTDVVLRLVGVTQQYGTGSTAVSALAGIDLDVAQGELVAVMGPSGSGKSTLLSIAGGLAVPTGGEVIVEGAHLGEQSPAQLARLRRRSLGFVFQDFNLIPTLTALENVTLPLELDGFRARVARRAGRDALASVGLDEKAHAYPDDLSGGQQQRVAIARAVVGGRRLILADEPTGALDSVTGEAVLRMLRSRVDAGAAGILVTHEARHAAFADRIVFLRDGRIVDESRRSGAESLLAGTR